METALLASGGHSLISILLEVLLTTGLIPVVTLLQDFINMWSGCGVGLALIGVFMFDAIYHLVAVDALHGVLEAVLAGVRLSSWTKECVTPEQWAEVTTDWGMMMEQGPNKLAEMLVAYIQA